MDDEQKETCFGCAFWRVREFDVEGQPETGSCHRAVPRVADTPDSDTPEGTLPAVWPLTRHGDYCGGFWPREEETPILSAALVEQERADAQARARNFREAHQARLARLEGFDVDPDKVPDLFDGETATGPARLSSDNASGNGGTEDAA